MTTTTNYGMQLPSGSDPASITPINQNTTFLDTKLKELEDVTDSVIDEIDKTTSSVSGSVLTITDSAPNSYVRSLVASIEAQQASGTPTPSNPLPISGFTGVTVTVEDDYDNPTEVETTTLSWQTEANTVYGGSIDLTSGVLTVTHKSIDLGNLTWTYDQNNTRFTSWNISDMLLAPIRQLELICEIYQTISDGRPIASVPNNAIYGGGDYRVIYVKTDSTTDSEAFKTAVTGYKAIYPLTTPLTYQLTPQTIKLLENNNTIFSDTGDTALTYVVSDKYSKGGIPTVEAVKQYVMEMLGL